MEDIMLKASMIAVCALALSASGAMAQGTVTVPGKGGGVEVLQYEGQQAMAPVAEDPSGRTFIHDEYGNLYDGHGQPITPHPVKLPHPVKIEQ
jgi:hypothetical protein